MKTLGWWLVGLGCCLAIFGSVLVGFGNATRLDNGHIVFLNPMRMITWIGVTAVTGIALAIAGFVVLGKASKRATRPEKEAARTSHQANAATLTTTMAQ